MDTEQLAGTKVTEDLNVNHPLGRDEFLYDLIGINVMGLKSLGTLLRNPADYFNAALSPDWESRHWPSMRLWLGLMTLLIGLQFIWASESSEMTAMFRFMAGSIIEGVNQGLGPDEAVDFSGFDLNLAGQTIFKNWIFIYPFFFIAFMCLLAFVFRGWERPLPYIARLRFIFAIIVPGSIIGIASTLLLLPLKGDAYMAASMATLPIILLTYCITAYRGAYAHCETGTRLGMSIVISILIMFALMLSQFTSMTLAMFTIIPDIKEVVDAHRAAAAP